MLTRCTNQSYNITRNRIIGDANVLNRRQRDWVCVYINRSRKKTLKIDVGDGESFVSLEFGRLNQNKATGALATQSTD